MFINSMMHSTVLFLNTEIVKTNKTSRTVKTAVCLHFTVNKKSLLLQLTGKDAHLYRKTARVRKMLHTLFRPKLSRF